MMRDQLRGLLRSYEPPAGPAKRNTPIAQRLAMYIDWPGNDEDCWVWCGTRNRDGYGLIGIDDRNNLVHRLTYELFVGPIPDGLQIDHLCRTRPCCNPAHLEPVTCRVNLLRGLTVTAFRAAQTHCIHGHEFTPENIRWYSNGTRHCRACERQRDADRRPRARAIRPASAA